MKSIHLSCPAKVNLHLRVLGRRPDGYHEIVTLMQPVEICDELLVELEGDAIQLQCDPPVVPSGEENLVWRAARLFREETGDRFGLKIHLRKRIPVAAGLGGGSSDAAGMLLAVNRLSGNQVPMERLTQWAVRLGADVPFFLQGHPALAEGIGEKLQPVRIVASWWYVVVFPGWSVSTEWSYRNLGLGLTGSRKRTRIPSLIERVEDVVPLLHNDLESVTAQAHPWVYRMKARLAQLGALGTLMSGSGPTVFGIFADPLTARAAWQRLRQDEEGTMWWVRGRS